MNCWLLLALLAALPGLPTAAQTPALPPADQARLECTYQLTYQPDSTQPTTRTDLLRLLVGGRLSRFESRNQLFQDSLTASLTAIAERAHASGEAIPTIDLNSVPAARFRVSFPGAIYKVPTAGQVVVFDKLFTTRYYYQEPPTLLRWTILPATATIAGYTCQRATTTLGGRSWEAWFARAVPIPEGPYKLYGLPGLIVKAGDTRGQFVYELLQLRQLPADRPIELPPAGAKAIGKQAFWQAKADYERTAAEQMLANGNMRFNTPEEAEQFRQKARERAKRKTNPLELR